MSKFYLLPFLFLAVQASAQSPQHLIPVRQGQNFTIRSPYSLPPGRNTLKNILRVAGVGAMAYGSEKILSRSNVKAPATIQESNRWLLPVGAALTLTADPIAGRKKDPGTYITYSLYNMDKVLVSRKVVLVTNKQLKKSGGIAVSGKATEDGFLQVSLSDDRTYTDNDDFNNGLVVALGSIDETESEGVAFSPVRASLEPVSTGRGSISAAGLLTGKAGRVPTFSTGEVSTMAKAPALMKSIPVAGRLIGGSRSLPKIVPGIDPVAPAGTTPGGNTALLLNKRSIPSAPDDKQRGVPFPEPFILFPPVGRFSVRSGFAGAGDDDTKEVDDSSSESSEGGPTSDFSSDLSSDPPGGGESEEDGDPDAGDPDDPCTATMINGGTPDDYQSCVCSLNPDASACAPADPTATAAATAKCNVCWVTFGAAVAAATANYTAVALPACAAGAPAAAADCRDRAAASYSIALSTAAVALGTCRFAAGCVI